MDKKTAILDFIQDEIMKRRDPNLSSSTDLLSTGVLDSLGILQLVAFIDERFGIQVPDEDVVYENFHSVDSLVAYLEQNPAHAA
ncbi:acyl carrier protein [Litorilinea aerophila]|uniref:Acyl carrier protein n=1 Tax=Litorilinea aerophila TaxID=1204385 RepID=A0A540VFG0_9CHLR|nr:acyl carrier protein [Litorilinea aerophila]MCC9076778.1 acyl carrier protein [Litorilinea aerophila]GIV76509.1 MAG: hypothetical protein KatS3mg050_0903 [Litorilinea sp.]